MSGASRVSRSSRLTKLRVTLCASASSPADRPSSRHRQLGERRVAMAGGSGYPARMTMLAPNRYAGHHFPPEIISHAVWLYFRFPLSLRMVEEMLAARGIVVSHERCGSGH